MTQKLKLSIELVPTSTWNQNLRNLLKKNMWDNVRNNIYKKFNYKCAICKSGGRLHAHEAWEYDDKNHIQKLTNIVALCSKCHSVKHLGFAGIRASQGELNYENLIRHFMKVNNCDRETFEKHRTEAFKKFEERSRHDWTLRLHSIS